MGKSTESARLSETVKDYLYREKPRQDSYDDKIRQLIQLEQAVESDPDLSVDGLIRRQDRRPTNES